ncbi:hypothetical protein Hdeb2414_s0011g00364531 [Helianthus debilis subsp. tardiflorus]
MSYKGGYPTVLKKLFPPYWRLLVHMFMQCIAENKGGFDQLNKTQTSALVALVNGWDYNFSAFIFDNMKKMLEDPKKKIFMLYPRFIQLILDEKHPALVKGPNYINLKPMGPGCFENAYRAKRAKQHNFIGKFALKKHGRFSDVVPAVPVVPAPQPINAQIAEEHDVQQVQQVAANEAEVETEILDSDSKSDSSEEETDSDSEVEVIVSEKEEEVGGDGNPPSAPTTEKVEVEATPEIQAEIEVITNDAEQAASKRQRTNTDPDLDSTGPVSDPEPTMSIEPKPDTATKETNTQEPDLYDFNFDFESTPSQQGSSTGVRFETGSSSGGVGFTELDEAMLCYAIEKRQVVGRSDSDSDEDANVARLRR